MNSSLSVPVSPTQRDAAMILYDALSGSVMSNSLWPHGLWSTRLLCPWGFSRQEYWSGLPCPPPGGLPNSGIEPRSPTLQVVSLPSEPLGKPMNIGLGSLSLLQRIFQTQESNWDLLHYRWILYKLGYQESQWCFINNLNELGVEELFLVSC